MAKELSLAAAAYKLVWLRVALYFIVPFFATYISETEDYSDSAWVELGQFRKNRIYAKCLFPGMLALVAFLDKGLSTGEVKYKELKAERHVEDRQERVDKIEDVAVARAEDRADAALTQAVAAKISSDKLKEPPPKA